MLSISEFKHILSRHRYTNIDPETEYNLYNFFVNRGMEYEDAYTFMNGAKKRAIISSENEKMVKLDILDLLRNHSTQADIALYKRINEIDKKFKEFYTNNKIKATKTDQIMKAINKAIKNRNDAFSQTLYEFTADELTKMYNVACIYNILNNTMGTIGLHTADDIISMRFASSIEHNQTLKINEELVKSIDGLLNSLTGPTAPLPQSEQFQPAEVERLLKRTVSLLYTTDKIKATAVRKMLKTYLDNLTVLAENQPKEKEFLNKTTAKSIILRAGSILVRTPESVEETLDLLMGKSVSQIASVSPQSITQDTIKQKCATFYPNLSIEGFSLDKHLYLLQHQASIIGSLNLRTLYQSETQLVDGLTSGLIGDPSTLSTIEKIDKLKLLGINPEALIHADNITDLIISNPLSSSEKQLNFSENIKLFSKVLQASDLEKVVKHNLPLLCQPPKEIETTVSTILLKNKNDSEKLKTELEKFINSPFTLLDSSTTAKNTHVKKMSIPTTNTETLDVNGTKEPIKINSLKITPQKATNVKTNKTTAPEVELNKDNYLNILEQELTDLSSYLTSKETNSTPALNADKLGGILHKINHGDNTPESIGAVKNRLKKIDKMLDFLKQDSQNPDKTYKNISSILTQINDRISLLDLEIAEVESIADQMFLSDACRNLAEAEKINEYLSELDFIKTKKNSIKSKGLIEKYQNDETFISSKIAELEKEHKNIHANREMFIGLYADRTAILAEQKCLNGISALFASLPQQARHTTEQTKKPVNQEEIARLTQLIALKKRRFNEVYPSEKAKKSSYAKKWNAKIIALEEKLNSLINSNEIA